MVVVKVPVRDGKPLIESAPAQRLLSKGKAVSEPATRLLEKVERKVSPPKPVYRWQDADGTWHFGQQPPPGVVAEPVDMPEVNSMPSEQVINRGI